MKKKTYVLFVECVDVFGIHGNQSQSTGWNSFLPWKPRKFTWITKCHRRLTGDFHTQITVSVSTTNLHCASRRRARSQCGSNAACTCPRQSPRCSEQRWPTASALSEPVPPFASETVSYWKLGSLGLALGPLVWEKTREEKPWTERKTVKTGWRKGSGWRTSRKLGNIWRSLEGERENQVLSAKNKEKVKAMELALG